MTSSAVSSSRRKDISPLDYTVDLLSGLNDEELEAIQAIAMAFIHSGKLSDIEKSNDTISPFQPQSEEQLLKRIDHSLSQIEAGKLTNAAEVEEELLAEISA